MIIKTVLICCALFSTSFLFNNCSIKQKYTSQDDSFTKSDKEKI